MKIENRGRIPGGNIRKYQDVICPSLDSTIDYRVAEQVKRKLYTAAYDRKRREMKLQEQKGQSIKS